MPQLTVTPDLVLDLAGGGARVSPLTLSRVRIGPCRARADLIRTPARTGHALWPRRRLVSGADLLTLLMK